tara:strand:+ start:683 stop:1762 length:1080 start_codon:yes stop_codon:yes gene_type:complete
MVKFSICIPNYNYSKYISETINSLLNQTYKDIEICISDNASTDESIETIKKYTSKHKFIKLKVNRCNVGYYENLKRAANMAKNDWMLMISSDDIAYKNAFEVYNKIINSIPHANRSVICSLADCIDSKSNIINTNKMNKILFKEAALDEELSKNLSLNVYKIKAKALLKKSLLELRNPLHFATTSYPRSMHDEIEGYSWGGIMGPDKPFVYKLLSISEDVYIVDSPLFGYRLHSQNNIASEFQLGGLKYLVDSYVITFNLDQKIINFADITRDKLSNAFIKNSIYVRIIYNLSYFRLNYCLRLILFGFACYPQKCLTSIRFLISMICVLIFPITSPIFFILRKFFYKDPTHKKYFRRFV